MTNLLRFDPSALPEPEVSAPAPDRVIEGDPRFRLWVLDAAMDDSRFAGYWASTPGMWRVSYDEWEYCTLIEGMAVVTEDGQPPVTLGPGDHIIFRPGFSGQWQVVEPVLKTFVVLMPPIPMPTSGD